MSDRYNVEDLLELMRRLRDPKTGCPWDIQQSFASIVPSTIEEAYEVADAIERRHFSHLEEELGDLLFQVIFYAQLGKEESLFDFDSVVHRLVGKLIRRHPHVFPSGDLAGLISTSHYQDTEIHGQWENLKKEERERKGTVGALADVPLNFPAISRAQKLQKRAAQVGFDFASARRAMDKVREELTEVEEEIAKLGDGSAHLALGAELGDLLFATINVCRLAKFDAETLLRGTNSKFERRFKVVEDLMSKKNGAIEKSSLQEMEAAWLHAKSLE